jgi:hypothetical protein
MTSIAAQSKWEMLAMVIKGSSLSDDKLELRYSLENGLIWEPNPSREPMVESHPIQRQIDFRYLMVMTISHS